MHSCGPSVALCAGCRRRCRSCLTHRISTASSSGVQPPFTLARGCLRRRDAEDDMAPAERHADGWTTPRKGLAGPLRAQRVRPTASWSHNRPEMQMLAHAPHGALIVWNEARAKAEGTLTPSEAQPLLCQAWTGGIEIAIKNSYSYAYSSVIPVQLVHQRAEQVLHCRRALVH